MEIFPKKKRKREPVPKSTRDHLLKFQNGKCANCGQSFKKKGVRTILNHKNMDPTDNRIVNLELICPDCHDKFHQKKRKVVKRVYDSITGAPLTDLFGKPIVKVVKKIERPTKKGKKRRARKRRRKSDSLFSLKF